MEFKYIETNRLLLRKMDESVLHYLKGISNDEELGLFFGIKGEKLIQKEKNRLIGGYTTFNKKILIFHLINKKTQTVIGWCGYHTWYIDHSRAELGYMIYDEENRNKAYMKEALKATLDYGFKKMDLQRVEALVGAENEPSLKLIEKYGFQKEGCLRNHYRVNGTYEDSLFFGLLKEEYAI